MQSQTCTRCGFVATGDSSEEVSRKMEEHARKAHGQMMQEMSAEPRGMRGTHGG